MMPWPGLLEPFTECLTLGVLLSLSLYYLMDWSPVWPFTGHVCLWFFLDMCLLSQIQVVNQFTYIYVHNNVIDTHNGKMC